MAIQDGRLIVTRYGAVSSHSLDLAVQYWLRPLDLGDIFAVCGNEIVVVVRTPNASAATQQFKVLDIANGEETRSFDAPLGILMQAISRDGTVLLCRMSASGEALAFDMRSGRQLWRGGPYGTYAVGTNDGFVVTSPDGLKVSRVEGASGRVLWACVPPRRHPQAGVASWRTGSITIVDENDLILHLETGGLLRLSLQTGEIVASGWLRWIGPSIVTARHVMAGGAEGLSTVDHATMVETQRIAWADEIREALHGSLPDTCGFYASQRAVVWTTGDGRLMGVLRPGARGGKRNVWSHRIPNAMFGTLHPIVSEGPYVYLDPFRVPGSVAPPPGVCCFISDEE
jgi:hypothetical protein